jgi:hypothetical protein
VTIPGSGQTPGLRQPIHTPAVTWREPPSGNLAEPSGLVLDGIETSLCKRACPNARDEPGDVLAAELPTIPEDRTPPSI